MRRALKRIFRRAQAPRQAARSAPAPTTSPLPAAESGPEARFPTRRRRLRGSCASRRNRARSWSACSRRDRRSRPSRPRRRASARIPIPYGSRRRTAAWRTCRTRTSSRSCRLPGRRRRAPFARRRFGHFGLPLISAEFALGRRLGRLGGLAGRALERARRCAPTCRGGRADNRAWRDAPCRGARP